MQAIRFQILQIPPAIIKVSGDLKYGIAERRTKCGFEVSTSKDYARNRHLWWIVDTIGLRFEGELKHLYRLCPVAVIGGSFLPGLAGHNLSEAAAAGCAVVIGHYVGHFSHMVKKMQQINPLSVMQVSGALELEEAIVMLFRDAKVLETRQMAAKQAFHALSSGVIANVWNLLNFHVFETISLRK